jgi:homoserine O-acetyltransferase/O-succinyltransferase
VAMQVERYTVAVGGMAAASLVYATWGTLNEAGDNAVLLPSYYTGTHERYMALIGPGRTLDPARCFVIAPNLFGNGVSTSPSHGAGVPRLTIEDNVHAQHKLLRSLGVTSLALAAGWSMGAMQALHWAMLYPAMVRNVVAVCGTAFCWPINTVFLRGIAPILENEAIIGEALALDLFGRAYCGWAYSAAFFRDGLYRVLGFETLEALLDDWAADHKTHRAMDLLAALYGWADTACPPAAARAALGRITARCFIVPCGTDSYFTVQDAAFEAACIPHATLLPLVSPFGHCAGAPGRFPAESARIEEIFAQALKDG